MFFSVEEIVQFVAKFPLMKFFCCNIANTEEEFKAIETALGDGLTIKGYFHYKVNKSALMTRVN